MALMTVTNTSGVTLNRPDVGGYGVSPDAVGGNVLDPLPYPFDRNGELADADTRTLAVNVRDFSTRMQMQQPSLPANDWDALLQKGYITASFTDDADAIDVENSALVAL